MFVVARGKVKLQDIFVTCTYEGVRSLPGRTEAYIGLSGVVKGRGAALPSSARRAATRISTSTKGF